MSNVIFFKNGFTINDVYILYNKIVKIENINLECYTDSDIFNNDESHSIYYYFKIVLVNGNCCYITSDNFTCKKYLLLDKNQQRWYKKNYYRNPLWSNIKEFKDSIKQQLQQQKISIEQQRNTLISVLEQNKVFDREYVYVGDLND